MTHMGVIQHTVGQLLQVWLIGSPSRQVLSCLGMMGTLGTPHMPKDQMHQAMLPQPNTSSADKICQERSLPLLDYGVDATPWQCFMLTAFESGPSCSACLLASAASCG